MVKMWVKLIWISEYQNTGVQMFLVNSCLVFRTTVHLVIVSNYWKVKTLARSIDDVTVRLFLSIHPKQIRYENKNLIHYAKLDFFNLSIYSGNGTFWVQIKSFFENLYRTGLKRNFCLFVTYFLRWSLFLQNDNAHFRKNNTTVRHWETHPNYKFHSSKKNTSQNRI